MFIDVVTWEQQAKVCKTNLRKGSPVCVDGRISVREYTDKSGAKRKVTEIVAERVVFLDFLGKRPEEDAGEDKW